MVRNGGSDQAVIERVPRARLEEAVGVLSEAFFDYPVMRWVIGDAGDDYSLRLRKLVEFFTVARFVRQDLVLAVVERSRMVAVANINLPRGKAVATDEQGDLLEPYRCAVWDDLGGDARERYDAYGAAADKAPNPGPHYHLGMIGVESQHLGRGHARRLLDHLHGLSAADPDSCGVSLATEKPGNVTLYEHFGYRIVSHEEVGEFETWGFFRPDAETD